MDNAPAWRLEIFISGPNEQWCPLVGSHPSFELAYAAGREVLREVNKEVRERARSDEVWVIFPDGRQKQQVLWSNKS